MEGIVNFFWATWEQRTDYGAFHLISLGIMVALIVLVCLTCRKSRLSDKAFRIISIVVGVLLILFEAYKQIVFAYDPATGKWDYPWHAFPFQFCSTPMYIILLAGIAKPGKFQEWCCDFLGTFGLLAGLLVMAMPGDVFHTTSVGVSIQTMFHHGMMVVIGIFVWVSGRAKPKFSSAFKALAVFAVCVAIAFALNEIVVATGANQGEYFNCFYISRHFNSTLPVFKDIQPQVPYVAFVLIYFAGFAIGAMIMTLIAMAIAWLCRKIANRGVDDDTHVNGTRIKY
ncbi:MAG: YwaF family protein [Clostridia bacterium]|nr:YwaF family protein [Clostridia bacterium]